MNTPSLREVIRESYRTCITASFNLTLLYLVTTIFMVYDTSRENHAGLFESLFPDVRMALLTITILVAIFVWNFIFTIMGMYLFITSYLLSKVYLRSLLVIFGLIFLLTIFHIFPGKEIEETYKWYTNLSIRFVFQGLSILSIVTVIYALAQVIILFIIGAEHHSKIFKVSFVVGLVALVLLGVTVYIFYTRETPVEKIELSCKGTFSVSYSYSTWNQPSYESYKELGRLYTASKDYPIFEKGKKTLVWRLETPNSIEYPSAGNYTDQPGNPIHFRTVEVTKDLITVYSHYESGYKKNESDNSKNSKENSEHKITINRVSGEWHDTSVYKTYWKDGHTGVNKFTYDGICEKAVPKF